MKWIKRMFWFVFIYFWFCLPSNLFENQYSTVLEDSKGSVLAAHIAPDGQWRFPLNDSISDKFKTALIEFEDKHFYNHWGISIRAISRAMLQNIQAKRVVSGGSTISMQVIRLSRERKGRFIGDKLLEMLMALRLETKFTKQEILNLHASHAPFGGNVVGLEAASWRYFGHNSFQLSWAEAATLAVLPNAPSLMHPGKNRTALKSKRDRLLKKMFEKGLLNKWEYETALVEPLPEKPKPLPQTTPHYMAKLSLNGKAGQRTITNIDALLQQSVNEVVKRHYEVNIQKNIANMAVVVLDVKTQQTLAYVGNTPCDARHQNAVDIASSPRSTGSILKPFLYAKAMQNGQITPKMLLADYPTRINGYSPQNYEESYDGMVPASQALARSLNIPAVRLLSEYGVTRFKENLNEIGLTTLFRPADDYGLSLILGGAEANLMELSRAYSELSRATQGIGNETKFDRAVAYEVLSAMASVNRPKVEMYWTRFDDKQKIAWKTGTSFGARDAWAIGLTTDYVVAVWVGNATGEGVPGMTGSSTAAPVLFDVFQLLPKSKWFVQPMASMSYVKLCKESGQRAGQHCSNVQEQLIPKTCLKARSCSFHKLISVSKITNERVYNNCEKPHNIVQKSWFVLPPPAEKYYKANHPDYIPLPSFKKGCDQTPDNLEIIYPTKNSTITIPVLLSGELGKIVLEAVHRQENAELFWYIDHQFIQTTKTVHQMEVQPPKGKHLLTVTDEQGQTESRFFWVE
ncbi:MAG: penicillin-binding protein 1C [Flavobacteriales bacterium]|nr:penicillin-binding protein 1C [Flavobacteriales bacterium]